MRGVYRTRVIMFDARMWVCDLKTLGVGLQRMSVSYTVIDDLRGSAVPTRVIML